MLCLRNFPVAKNSMDKKGVLRFSVESFCLTWPKNSAGETFSVSPISVMGIFFASEGCHNFLSKVFLSHSTEKIRRGTVLCCVSEKFR